MRIALLLILSAAAASAQTDFPSAPTSVSPATQGPLPYSAAAHALSDAGAFGHTDDPVRLFHNPALLSDLADRVRLSGTLTPELNGVGDIRVSGGAISGGFQSRLAGRPLAVALGLATAEIDYGSIIIQTEDDPDPQSASASERTTALGVGARWDGPVSVRAGIAAQGFWVPVFRSITDVEDSRALGATVGLDVTAPLGHWIQPAPSESGLRLILNVTGGYARRGIVLSSDRVETEDNVVFVSTNPRNVVGAATLLGLEVSPRGLPLRAFSAERFYDLQTDADLTVRVGSRLHLLETLSFSAGTLTGSPLPDRTTAGIGVNVGGLLKAVGAITGNTGLYGRGQRIDVRCTLAAQAFEGSGHPFGSSATLGVVIGYRP